jgi:ABC-type microcin C transport system duplicated ATPase subunit YejF
MRFLNLPFLAHQILKHALFTHSQVLQIIKQIPQQDQTLSLLFIKFHIVIVRHMAHTQNSIFHSIWPHKKEEVEKVSNTTYTGWRSLVNGECQQLITATNRSHA